MRRKSCLALFLLVVAGLASCARSYPTDLWQLSSNHEYYRVARAHTRDTQRYADMNRGYDVYVTLKTPQFRAAYVEEYALRYDLPAADKEALRAKEQAAAAGGIILLLAMNGYERSWEKLQPSAEIWKLYCAVNRGARYKPNDPKRRTKDPKLVHFFPYVHHWSAVYEIECPFPEELGGWDAIQHVRLQMAGVLGNSEFEWTLPLR